MRPFKTNPSNTNPDKVRETDLNHAGLQPPIMVRNSLGHTLSPPEPDSHSQLQLTDYCRDPTVSLFPPQKKRILTLKLYFGST